MKKRASLMMAVLLIIVLCCSGYGKDEESPCYCPPKYVFLFIGDGMSYPQLQLTNYYLNAMHQKNGKKEGTSSTNQLSCLDFPVLGSAQTYNKNSFIPDSSSAGSAIASGKKTVSESLNMSPGKDKKYKTIAEKLKKKKYKIGIVSSVNINHATPAAFYAHQPSRKNYYEIGLEMIKSKFDYFAGGALLQPKGADGSRQCLYELAEEEGYEFIRTQKESQALTPESSKSIVIAEHLADSNAFPYEIERPEEEWALYDYVKLGIQQLYNERGFFLMVEGGKIDWACHANDAATVIHEVKALDDAVEAAVDFYLEHPNETLILVTGDHETGGLSLGAAATGYDTFLKNLNSQKISFTQFDAQKVTKFKTEQIPFEDAMKEVEQLFGLRVPEQRKKKIVKRDSMDAHPHTSSGTMELSSYEYEQLKEAYQKTLENYSSKKEYSEKEYEEYGSYEPFTVTLTHVMARKSGIGFGSYAHTALPVPVLAKGIGAGRFSGYYDNTDIFQRLCAVMELK